VSPGDASPAVGFVSASRGLVKSCLATRGPMSAGLGDQRSLWCHPTLSEGLGLAPPCGQWW